MNVVQDVAQYLERLLTRKVGPQRVGHRYDGISVQEHGSLCFGSPPRQGAWQYGIKLFVGIQTVCLNTYNNGLPTRTGM